MAQLVKNLPAVPETQVRSLGREDLLEKEMAIHSSILGFPGGSDGKESACDVGDPGSIPGSGRSSGEGNGNPLQYSCLENLMDGKEPAGLQSMGSVLASSVQQSESIIQIHVSTLF